MVAAMIFFTIESAYAENVTLYHNVPIWYSYDCSLTHPTSWNQITPEGFSKFRYFSLISDSDCYATLNIYDFEEIEDIKNVTGIYLNFDTKAQYHNDLDSSRNFTIGCDVFYFSDPDLSSIILSFNPAKVGNFTCAGGNDNLIETLVPLNSTYITDFRNRIAANDFSFGYMLFPQYNATTLSLMDSESGQLTIGHYKHSFTVDGVGIYCFFIRSTDMCGFFDNPWNAIKKMMGEDWIGDWFYVFVFLPLPMIVFLTTRNGTYAGFIGLGIMLVIETIDRTVFEIALSMILICAAFAFYDVFRNKILGSG